MQPKWRGVWTHRWGHGERTPRTGSKAGTEVGKTCWVCWTEEGEKAGQAEGTATGRRVGNGRGNLAPGRGWGRRRRQPGEH